MVVQNRSSTDLVSTPLKSDKKHRLKQRFDVQRKLGQGTYGKVQLAVNRETGQEVAIKTIKKSKIESEQDLVRIRREIQIMSSIQHPHIIHIYEVFENKDKIVLVMQFASGGELYDYLSEKKVLSDLEARRIFRQISAAVYYCHKNKICHRDLKLENILLDEKGNAKIADFGLSNVFDEKNLLSTYCGSPLYASPEIVKGVPYYGPEVDCWSMGVLLYTLVYGAMPFDGSNFKKLVSQISEGDYFEPKKKSNASDLIRKLLTVDPSKRATIVDICVDSWVNLGYEHSLLQVAADMANLTPVRLDLLLALAPGSPVPEEVESEKPLKSKDVTLINKILEKDIPDEEEEEEEDDDYNPDTVANSFAFMKGSRASQLSISSPNLQEVVDEYVEDSEDEFLPADIAAALQAECGKRLAESSFSSSLARISSLAHQSKKPRKSDSISVENKLGKDNNEAENNKVLERSQIISCDKSKLDIPPPKNKSALKSSDKINIDSTTINKSVLGMQKIIQVPSEIADSSSKNTAQNESQNKGNSPQASASVVQRKESLTNQEEKETKRPGRPPGKIIIPKTFHSPQSTPSPKPGPSKKLVKSDSKTDTENVEQAKVVANADMNLREENKKESSEVSVVEDVNKNLIKVDSKEENKENTITEEKKNIAKGILKKGIAKAKLAERRMSKQSSVDSEASTASCSTPVSTTGTSEPLPSFYKAPKPYAKEEEASVTSKAEIKLSSTQSSNSTLKNEIISSKNAPLWDSSSHCNERKLVDRSQNWSVLSSTIDSELSGWKEQMEESLRRLSPDDERSSNQSYSLPRIDDDKPLVPIARSYKKFTFTKDGACITETKKIYTTPGADGSWTKVEKKTKITTRPGNAEEFERFRDLHLRNESPCLTRSDSQSSSGSNEVYDDIFDSWTGDTMMCNMRKMNSMFQKFSKDPFLRKERRRNPFRLFRRTESERNEREKMHYEVRSGRSNEQELENEEDCDLHFDDSNAVVYGSQGLWQLLRSTNRGFPGRVTIQHEPVTYGRSASQDRSESKYDSHWKRSSSRASSGYNTGTRSQSRDRTESPREKVLRFVFESPRESFSRESSVQDTPSRQEKWSLKRNISRHNPRRDSGVGSDGYESEYSVRPSPSDEFSRAGRVSSMSSVCSGGKQDMIKNFMKSWSKEFMSPPISPTSLGSGKERSENFPESRKHRVEQWLHMNSESPFDVYSDAYPSISSRKSSTSHSNNSGYATMRPREYFHYNRSSSDKLSGCADFFPSFEDSHRRRSQSLNKEAEANKIRFRSSTYSPVTEESLRETHSSHSDGSGSSVHQINFTFSDGRASSSLTNYPTTTRYVRHFSSSNEGGVELSPPAGFRVEQISPRIHTQPVVQMRVSINRNNRDNQMINVSSQSKGLWEQQESLTPAKPESSPREPSPVPGIRQFSTEVQHCVGSTDESPQMSVQCEVTNGEKPSTRNAQTGKNSPYKHLPTETSIWDLACPPICMDPELTNMNQAVPKMVLPENSFDPNDINNRPKKLLLLKMGYDRDDAVNIKSLSSISNGANTPDSLEDLTMDQQIRSEDLENTENSASNCNKSSFEEEMKIHVDVKPFGVLWKSSSPPNSCNPKKLENVQCATYAQIQNSSSTVSKVSDESEQCDYQQICLEKTSSEIGSIWNQKNTCQTFDLLKNLLSDDGLESFSSSKCVRSSSHNSSNYCSDPTVNENSAQTVFHDKHISVIDNIDLERLARRDKINKISILDELQSPKEVLRQAMKICDSFEPIK